jgi:hypothetical protein
MAKKQDIMEINIELHEENRKLLKAVKSGADIAHLIKDMAQTMKRSLDLAEKEVSIFGETRELFETSKDLTESMKNMAEILINEYRYEYKDECELIPDNFEDSFDDSEEE